MLIHRMPDVLAWRPGREQDWLAVHDGYQARLADRLGDALARADRHWPGRAQDLRAAIAGLSNHGLQRFLFAPETASRLLWPACHDPAEALAFLGRGVAVERALEAGDPGPARRTWSALGDAWTGPTGPGRQPSVAGLPPLDLISPHARAVDLEGEAIRLATPRAAQPAAERRIVLARLTAIGAALARLGPAWPLFVRTFTKVLVLQPDPDAPRSFSSGTSGQYPGRSLLANAHLPSVSLEVIADGLVHESIHGLLYMQEQQRPWVLTDALYGGQKVTRSPWTGTPLPLRPYMQAAFVWYGLLHFWSQALAAGVFDPARARERLRIAARGFLGAPLVSQLEPFRSDLAPELPDAIGEMQHRVRTELEAALHA